MNKKLILVLLIFIASANAVAKKVTTDVGEVIGFEKYGIQHFLGVPYAQAPIGELRWQPPVPVTKFVKPVDASSYGDICVQPGAKPDMNMSEDCLNLNIWTAKTKAKLPVMVWFHGGGFKTGSNRVLGTTFAAKGAVVVALNYRLGPLGFFAHPELKLSSANPGVLDMVAGLKWVKENISHFGGDANNITIFGVSAGGMAVNLMATNKAANGLFNKAIAQSGYATWPLPRTARKSINIHSESAEKIAIDLITKVSPGTNYNKTQLLDLPAAKLVNAVEGFVLPIVDGESVEEEPGIVFLKGEQNAISLVTGGNSFEGSVKPYSGVSDKAYRNLLSDDYQNIRKQYDVYTGVSESLIHQLMWGENRYLLSAYVTANAMAHQSKDAWLYYVDFVPEEYKGKTLGTTHGSDAQMLWGGQFSANTEIKAVSLRLQNYWFNFAKIGMPTQTTGNNDNPHWLRLNKTSVPWLSIGYTDRVEPLSIIERLKLFEDNYKQRIQSLL